MPTSTLESPPHAYAAHKLSDRRYRAAHCTLRNIHCFKALLFTTICLLLVTLYVQFLPRSSHLSHKALHQNRHDPTRPRAALISLVRNSELSGIQQSIRQLEYHFNSKAAHQYPWVFFNDVPFTEEFIEGTLNLTSGRAYYEVIPKEHWSFPQWIDQERFMNSLEYLGSVGVGKGWLVSYR